jgi:hypothetical protein
MAPEFVRGLPMLPGFDQWYERIQDPENGTMLGLGPILGNSYMFLPRPTPARTDDEQLAAKDHHKAWVWTVRGGPDKDSGLTRRASGRHNQPTVYTFESGLQVAGVFCGPEKKNPTDTADEESQVEKKHQILLVFEGLLKHGHFSGSTGCKTRVTLEIRWSLLRRQPHDDSAKNGTGDILSVRTISRHTPAWSARPYCYLEREELFRACAVPPTFTSHPGVATRCLSPDSIWKSDEDYDSEEEYRKQELKKKLKEWGQQKREEKKHGKKKVGKKGKATPDWRVVVATSRHKENYMATSGEQYRLQMLYGSAFRAALWADITPVLPLKEYEDIPPPMDKRAQEELCTCASAKDYAKSAALAASERVIDQYFDEGAAEAVEMAAKDPACRVHGHCDMCEMTHRDCFCEWWFEAHSCRHCNLVLGKCCCSRRKAVELLYKPRA